MAFIEQKYTTDCGVCCLAMIVDCSWDEACWAIGDAELAVGKDWEAYSTSTRQLKNALPSLNAMALQQRLKPLPHKRVSDSDSRLQEKIARWNLVPDNSLVKIKKPFSSSWHWVTKRKGKIYDPARGVYTPKAYDHFPSSFLEVLVFQDTMKGYSEEDAVDWWTSEGGG